MYEAPGIGLAATQLGVMQQVFVMDCAGKDEPPEPMVLINPEIVWRSEETETSEEGCLSIPEVYEDVTRPARVRLRWMGLDGATHEAEFGDRWAVCAQHEIDHLNGRLFIDYLSAVKRTMITVADEEAEAGEGAGLRWQGLTGVRCGWKAAGRWLESGLPLFNRGLIVDAVMSPAAPCA